MKSDTLISVALEGNLAPLDARQMGIHSEALAAVTDSLINLYTDKDLAVIREYSTNARDAMVEAGNGDQPILVTLPKSLNPVLTVQDFGIGMSKDQVLEFYSQYGASDKRNSNTQIGAFGFGCKAAFAISEQFTVVSVKDGWSTTAIFHRNSQGIGTASVLSHTPSDEPNGVTVQVPVNNVSTMRDTAVKFFKYWDKGTVLVDGEEPFSRFSDVDFILGNVRLIKGDQYRYGSGTVYVRMGQVLYPFSGRTAWANLRLPAQVDLVLSANIGDVDIVPSREGLRDTDRTTKWLNDQYEELESNVVDYFSGIVSQEKTFYDAVNSYTTARKMLPESLGRNALWTNPADPHDQRLINHASALAAFPNTTAFTYSSYNETVSRHEAWTADIAGSHKVLVIKLPDGYDMEHVNRRLRRGMKLLFSADVASVILLHNEKLEAGEGWFSLDLPFVEVVSLDDYIETRRQLSAKARKERDDDSVRTQPVYKAVIPNLVNTEGFAVRDMVYSDLKGIKTVYYYRDARNASSTHASTVTAVIKETPFPDTNTVVLVLNQWQQESTVANRFPGARPFHEYATLAADKFAETFTAEEIDDIRAYQAANSSPASIRNVVAAFPKPEKIWDPEFRSWIAVYGKTKATTLAAWKKWGRLTSMPLSAGSKKLAELRDQTEAEHGFEFDRYPLLDGLIGYYSTLSSNSVPDAVKAEHALEYVNMMYLKAKMRHLNKKGN